MAESQNQERQSFPEWTNDIEYDLLLDTVIPTRENRGRLSVSVVLPVTRIRAEFTRNLVTAEEKAEQIVEAVAGSVGRFPSISEDVKAGAKSVENTGLTKNEKSLLAILLANKINTSAPEYTSDRRSERLNALIPVALKIGYGRLKGASEERQQSTERYLFLQTVVSNVINKSSPSDTKTDLYVRLLLDGEERRNPAPFDAIKQAKDILQPILTDRRKLPGLSYDPENRPDRILSHEYRAKRLRSPYLRSFFSLLSKDVDFKRFAQQFLDRGDEFAERTKERDETHREFTALFSAILSSERIRELFNTALDRAAMAESQKIAEALEANYTYVPTLVIGSGLAGSIYTSELLHGSPTAQVLTIDSSKRLGGQFAEAEAAALALNSRTRPQNNDEPGIPGNPGNLNPLGPHAVIQLPDITGSTYATQEDFATAIRTNKFLSGPTLLNASATSYEIIPKSERINPKAKYKVTIEYTGPEGVKQLKIITDRIRQLTGVGKEAFPLLDAQDEETQEVIARAKNDIDAGIIPKILHSSWVYQIIGDRSHAFPRKFFTGDVIVIGSNDSANTVMESLLGYGPDNRGPIQLDWPRRITWIGQPAITKQDFLKKARPRYARVGLDLERSGYSYQRITSKPGKALRIEQNFTDTIQVFWLDEKGNTQDAQGDRVIFATGFTDEMPALLEPISQKRIIVAPIDIFDREKNIRENLLRVDAQLFFEDGSTHTIIKRTPKTVTVVITKGPSDPPEQIKFKLDTYASDLKPVGVQPSRPSVQALTEPVVDSNTGKVIGRRIPNEDIIIAGVAASIPITADDIPTIDTFGFIGENTVAAFFNEPKIVSLAAEDARILSEIGRPKDSPRTALDVLEQSSKKPKSRIQPTEVHANDKEFLLSTLGYLSSPPYSSRSNSAVKATRLSNTINAQDLARIAASGLLDDIEFPVSRKKSTVTLRFKRRPQDFLEENERIVEVYATVGADLEDELLIEKLNGIARSPDILGIVESLTKSPRRFKKSDGSDEIIRLEYDSEATLYIPIFPNGTVDTNNISIRKNKGRARKKK